MSSPDSVGVPAINLELTSFGDQPNQPNADDASQEEDNRLLSRCRPYCVAKGNNKSSLFPMAVGLEDVFGCFDLEKEPYKSSKARRKFLPTNVQYCEEVMRRWQVDPGNGPMPRPKAWKKEKLWKWLKDNPIRHEEDVEYVTEQLRMFKTHVESLCSGDPVARSQTRWYGPALWLRLYHAIVDDSLRHSFTIRDNTDSRDVLDARNSSARPPSFYEGVASLWSDVSFCPESLILPSLHGDFAVSIDLSLNSNAERLTAETAKSKMTEVRCKLMKVSGRC
ncbi:MAG: hypothetical protein ACRDL7_00540 [Gaiellaceae bacterium]